MRLAAGALVPVVILAAWQLVTATGLVPAYRLPAPLTVLQAGGDLVSRVHTTGEMLHEEHLPEGTRVHALVDETLAAELAGTA